MSAGVEKKRGGDWLLVFGGVFLAADVFGLDLWLQPGIAVCVGYALVVLLGIGWPGCAYILTAAVGCTLLTALGFYLSPEAADWQREAADRGLAVFAIWVTAIACLVHNKEQQRRQRHEQALSTLDAHLQRLEREKAEAAERLREQQLKLESVKADQLVKEQAVLRTEAETRALRDELEREKSNLRSAQNETKRLRAEQEAVKADAVRLRQERDSLKEEVWNKEEQLRLVKKNLKQAERDLLTAGDELEQSEAERQRLSRSSAGHEAELNRLKDAVHENERARRDREAKLSHMETLWLRMEQDILQSAAFLDQLKREREALETQHRQREERIQGLEAANRQLQEEAARTETRTEKTTADPQPAGRLNTKSEAHAAPQESVWLWQIDAHGTFTHCSAGVQALLGHAPGDLVGQRCFFDLFDPACREEARTTAFNVFAKRETIEGVVFPYVHRDGRRVYLQTRAAPVWGETGAFLGYRGEETRIPAMEPETAAGEAPRFDEDDLEQRVRERTRELIEINERLRKELDAVRAARMTPDTGELRRSNRELREFAAVASHDLKEPLRKVAAFSHRLRKDCAGELGEKGQDYLDRMEKAVHRMQGLIEDLLKYSQVSTRGPLSLQKIRLNEVADGALAMLEALIARTRGRVDVGPLPELRADRMQMHQLFQNLIANALKFHRPGVPPVVHIRHRLLPSGSHEIRVEDNGIGFDPGHLDRIFKPFERLHGRSEYEGSGLGLSICRKIAQRHGGDLTAASRPGTGSSFILTLPPESPRTRGEGPAFTNGGAG